MYRVFHNDALNKKILRHINQLLFSNFDEILKNFTNKIPNFINE